MLLDTLPRVKLAHLPTPMQEAPRLSSALRGPRILLKRDDLTGLAIGGNKVRKLEFVMGDAKKKGADIVLTTGAPQSNHTCQTAAAARKLGMDVYLVLFGGVHPEKQGNALLNNLYNVEIEVIGESIADLPKAEKRLHDLATELRSKGRTPYVIPSGAMMPEGAVGYVLAVSEICTQLKELGITVQYLVDCCGTGSTMAGLVLGAKYFKAPFDIIGVSVFRTVDLLKPLVADMANRVAKLLEVDLAVNPEELVIYDDYIGKGYGVPTKEGIEAIRLVAQTEGIILDPVYTGKTMAGLVDLIHKGVFTPEDTVIFLCSGGIPGVFAYNEELTAQFL